MEINADTFEHLGVSCAALDCPECQSTTTYSVYRGVEDDDESDLFGCNECGCHTEISNEVYDALYELSFDFDQVQSGELSAREFSERMPAHAVRFMDEFLAARKNWKCRHCGSYSPIDISACWKCDHENPDLLEVRVGVAGFEECPACETLIHEKDEECAHCGWRPAVDEAVVKRGGNAVVQSAPGKLVERSIESGPLPIIRFRNSPTSRMFRAGLLSGAYAPLGIAGYWVFGEPLFQGAYRMEGILDWIFVSYLGAAVCLFPLICFLLMFRMPRLLYVEPKGLRAKFVLGEKVYQLDEVKKVLVRQEREYVTFVFGNGRKMTVEASVGELDRLNRYFALHDPWG